MVTAPAAPRAAVTAPYQYDVGSSTPIGATVDAGGVNFCVYAEHATRVQLLLFAVAEDPQPMQTIDLEPNTNRTFHFWHVYVQGLPAGAIYAYRVDGPWDPRNGFRFNADKVLIDPYGRGHSHALWSRGSACQPGDNVATSMRSIVVDTDDYDWEGDKPINRPLHETIIYEMHVGGFTRSPSAKAEQPGTFAGVVERIPYLKSLGVTAVELLPVFDFDYSDVLRPNPEDGSLLRNYWGYDPHAWFAPVGKYCRDQTGAGQVREFRDMVKALHRAGIEVILDVVFNHTAEGNHLGPTMSFKGFDNPTYYMLSPADRSYYMDFSGCGNTVFANHPVVERMVSDCLHYWVEEMHVDGFRFDEGSVLSRGSDGAPLEFPPVIWRIELSGRLAKTKVIAEAWDAGGLYQVGSFPGARWAQWNGRYRDDLRDFVRGTPGIVGSVASRICGSADIFQPAAELPTTSVNFITAHDGFTLNDLVSYNGKHNQANGEGNRDGVDDNRSWNCGVEGATDDPDVEALRERQIRNFAALLLLSQGVPMFVMGDEVRRTQAGNNNAYCQDNDITWFDWDLTEKNDGLLRFFQRLIAFRKSHASLRRRQFFTGAVGYSGLPDVSWHGCRLGAPGWSDPNCRVLSMTLGGLTPEERDLHVVFNMESQALDFEVPAVEGRVWRRCVDTALPSPSDISDDPEGGDVVTGGTVHVQAHSTVVLVGSPAVSPAVEDESTAPSVRKAPATKLGQSHAGSKKGSA